MSIFTNFVHERMGLGDKLGDRIRDGTATGDWLVNGMDPHWPWGAFVIGHHLESLTAWTSGLRMVLDPTTEGKVPAPAELPVEFEELKVACGTIANVPSIDGRSLAGIVAAANRLESISQWMLFEVQNSSDDIQGDLDAQVSRELFEIEKISKTVFRSAPELEAWRKLGAFIGEMWPNWRAIIPDSTESSFTKLVEFCHELNCQGDFAFLENIEALVDPVNRHGALRDLWNTVELGFEPGMIHPDRLATYLKTQLWDHEPYTQYFDLSADRLRLFGRDVNLNEFGKHNMALLWVLCENRRTLLSHRYVITQAGLKVSAENLKTNVSRLRNKLRPLITGFFASSGKKPENIVDCFINLRRSGGYCGLDTIRATVKDPRPDWMPPPTKPLSHEAKDWQFGDELSGR